MRNLPLGRTFGTYSGAFGATVLFAGLGAYVSPPLVLVGLTLMFVVLVPLNIYSWETEQRGGAPSRHRDDATHEFDGTGKD